MKQFRTFIEGADGGTGDKEAYKKFFAAKLKKYGVDSPEDLSDADKKKFYDEIDREWNSDDEAGKDGKVKKEYIKHDGIRRRCAGGDGRKNKKVKTEAKGVAYMEHEIVKACKKVRMSPGEQGDFFAALEGK
jgi:hypothetical protein